MRPLLKGYIAAIAMAAVGLFAFDLAALPTWHVTWSPQLAVGLLLLTIVGEHVQFEVRRGWYTNCSAVPHIAAAFLFPPGVAMALALLGAGVRTVRHPLPPAKVIFNAAAIGIAVLGASHVAAPMGGPDLVRTGGAWSDPITAVIASATYYLLSAAMVAGAVALDQHRPFLQVIGGRIGVKAVSEIGLGLVGAMLAAMLLSATNWA